MSNKLNAGKIIFLIFLIVATIYILQKENRYITDSGKIFGTYYNITYKSEKSLKPQIEKVLRQVDNSLSPFNKKSIITKINNNEDTTPDSMFVRVFTLAQKISEKTDGAFDITVAPLVNAWGFGFKNGTPPDSAAIDSIKRFTDYRSVALLNNKITKKHPETMLDCSAIAKGYACDEVARLLECNGIKDYLVEIGGEIVAAGVNDKNSEWLIGINKPVDDASGTSSDLQEILRISGKSMATSGNYRNFRYENGKKVGHTIDPRSGYPVQHSLLSATVIADDCATADAYATAFMVVGTEKAIDICNQTPSIEAFLIYADSTGNLKTAETKGIEQLRK